MVEAPPASIALLFQSTHPVRGATALLISSNSSFRFQSTHPVRGATVTRGTAAVLKLISIHAPREGCDTRQPSHGVPS